MSFELFMGLCFYGLGTTVALVRLWTRLEMLEAEFHQREGVERSKAWIAQARREVRF